MAQYQALSCNTQMRLHMIPVFECWTKVMHEDENVIIDHRTIYGTDLPYIQGSQTSEEIKIRR